MAFVTVTAYCVALDDERKVTLFAASPAMSILVHVKASPPVTLTVIPPLSAWALNIVAGALDSVTVPPVLDTSSVPGVLSARFTDWALEPVARIVPLLMVAVMPATSTIAPVTFRAYVETQVPVNPVHVKDAQE